MYDKLQLEKIRIEDVSFGLRQVGTGEDLVFIHGFPTHGYTWRKILPQLSEKYYCHIIDLPGLGASEWSRNTDFNIAAQATKLKLLLSKLNIDNCSLIAHDSGGTIARILAIKEPTIVKNLILINTEMPNHRPPFIELYQKIGLLPFMPFYFRKKLSQQRFVKSSMGFKQAYSDKSMLDDISNLGPYLDPVIESKQKTIGAFKFLKGIDWQIVDGFQKTHADINSRTLLIWGEDDKTFPIHLAKKMALQFESHLEFMTIKNASLLPHEEKPEEVAKAIQEFLE